MRVLGQRAHRAGAAAKESDSFAEKSDLLRGRPRCETVVMPVAGLCANGWQLEHDERRSSLVGHCRPVGKGPWRVHSAVGAYRGLRLRAVSTVTPGEERSGKKKLLRR